MQIWNCCCLYGADQSSKVGCIAGKGDRLLSEAAAADGDMGGTSAKRLCCENAAHADPPEPTHMRTTDPKGCMHMSAADRPELTQTTAPNPQWLTFAINSQCYHA